MIITRKLVMQQSSYCYISNTIPSPDSITKIDE